MNLRTLLILGAGLLSAPLAAQEATGGAEPEAPAQEAVVDEVDEASEAGAAEAMPVDLAAGEALYQEVCRACHGPRAQGMASFPKLAGQDAAYLSERLHQYKAGEKVGNNSALMYPIAEDLSEQDIANVTAYIAETL